MRIVSMVPSWTETLLAANIDVVGRTRFCIHPKDAVASIPVVGGTKDWKWDKLVELKPELILLDQEENPKFMSVQNEIPWHATHVESVHNMPAQLSKIGDVLSNDELKNFGRRWEMVLKKQSFSKINFLSTQDFVRLPGVLEWGQKPEAQIKNVIYMIWKNPWMCVSANTFIGSMMKLCGIELPTFETKYPKIDLAKYDPKETLILFSSEPYPFLKKKADQKDFLYPHAYVDGESFSWFGIRSLKFLEGIE